MALHRLVVAGLLLLTACGGSDTVTGPPEDLVITRITQPGFSGYDAPQRLVIRSQPAWQLAWQTIWQRAGQVPALPAVNFNQEMVVLVAAGTKPTSGFFITIDAATATRDQATVRVRSIAPGANCTVNPVLTQPLEAVRIPVRAAVTFEEVSEVRACGS